MSRVRPGDLTVAAIALGTIVVITVAGVFLSPGESSVGGRASSFNAGPDGGKAAFVALKELGYTVERSYEPLSAIEAPPEQTTLIVASPLVDESEQDRRAVRRFIEGGGIVLATGEGGASLLGGKVQHVADPISARQAEVYRPVAVSPLVAGASEITMGTEATASFGGEYLELYGPHQEPVVRSARIGAGRAIWWAGSAPLTNGAVAERDNLALLLNAVGGSGRLVLWDEHYHGYRRSLWSYAKRTPLPWAAAQLALVALAAALTFSRRREPVRRRVIDPRTSPMEFVETVGGLYERAGAAPSAVFMARERLRRLLLNACGLAPATSDVRLARAAASRIGLNAAALGDLLARAARDARDQALRTEEALPIVQELQAAAAAVVASRSGRPGRAEALRYSRPGQG